jgi:hypothetical protein
MEENHERFILMESLLQHLNPFLNHSLIVQNHLMVKDNLQMQIEIYLKEHL